MESKAGILPSLNVDGPKKCIGYFKDFLMETETSKHYYQQKFNNNIVLGIYHENLCSVEV